MLTIANKIKSIKTIMPFFLRTALFMLPKRFCNEHYRIGHHRQTVQKLKSKKKR
jgi:hypothetical protein